VFALRTRRVGVIGAATIMLAAAVPAFAASTVDEKLSEYKIAGGSSAKAGSVTFKVKNVGDFQHELVVIKTSTKAAKLKTKDGKAVVTGQLGEVKMAGGKTKSLKLTLKKGHYALICNIGDHYAQGMHKDFTVK
jgi:uncharacterized cupredoxin-like copper-binding protein